MLNLLGFSAQLIALISITAIVISCISFPQPSSVVISATCIPCAEVSLVSNDATQSVVYSAKSMTPPLYTTVVDKLEFPSDDLSCLTIRQLKALCREQGFKRYSSLRKHELIALLSEF